MPGPEYKKKSDTTKVDENTQHSNAQTAHDQSTSSLEEANHNELIKNSPSMTALDQWTKQVEASENSKSNPSFQRRRRPGKGRPKTKRAARLKGDTTFNGIFKELETLKKGDKGIQVVKLQQALLDMGYTLPEHGVDGKFGNETKGTLEEYQKDNQLPLTGELDKATISMMDARFDTREDYINAGQNFDPQNPKTGSRELPDVQKNAAIKALQPTHLPFKEDQKDEYADAIRNRVASLINKYHKTLYKNRKNLRKDKKNLHKTKDVEGAANAGKKVTDSVYGHLQKGAAYKMGTTLQDQWAEQERLQATYNESERLEAADYGIRYLINSECTEINKQYNADPDRAVEKALLDPIVQSFMDSDEKVQKLLDIDKGWEATEGLGIQNIQMFKFPPFLNEENRLKMWEIFHVSIHEYLHTLAHLNFYAWADKLGGASEHTLVEGFCDFYTQNVRALYPESKLVSMQEDIEGSFFSEESEGDIPSIDSLDVGVYDAHEEAERMVGIIGIRNAQLGYFKGLVEYMGQ